MLITDKESFKRLQKLNQLALTEKEETDVLAFFTARNEDITALGAVDTENVERMVHVMPMETVVREDKEIKLFTRDELQKSAPESYEGYWQVPRLVE
ncbi:MAG: Asp-tRNA(Asn)/Glu-tRNA(Gln) amidotransferase subunit GatC [Clostridia bacterium]|nr:Asp-tRNA(Asn)/Glu-tRNA(Gln) amidotransferase subunit GatC [Clostridia bacterium]